MINHRYPTCKEDTIVDGIIAMMNSSTITTP